MALVERSEQPIEKSRLRPQGPRRPPRAALDLRLPWPMARAAMIVGLLVVALFGIGTKVMGSTQYHGELALLVLKLNDPQPSLGIEITDRRVTAITAIARSKPFLFELQRESGVAASVEELDRMVDATRPNLGAIALITVTGPDRGVVERLTAHLSTAMSEVVDRVRNGSLTLTESNGLNIARGDAPEYSGPLYIELFTQPSGGQRATISETQPRVAANSIVGLMLGMLGLVTVGLLAHQSLRATDREDLEQLLDLDHLGGVPRPDRRRPEGSARALLGFANSLAAMAANAPHSVAIGGTGTRRIRGRFARSLACASAAATSCPVVLVDLDPSRLRSPGHRRGILDAAADPQELATMIKPIRRWSVPRWARVLGGEIPVGVVALGHMPESAEVAEESLAAGVALLATHHVVILNLPGVSGPLPVGSALAAVDLGVVLVLDGWTLVDDARTVADALEAAVAGPVGFTLMEN
ncbi:MAG: hypothetical protein IT195_08975 [Microthrixaceae bacterium]|nr:hypothetical protein [Microthrixaceae bacterium]